MTDFIQPTMTCPKCHAEIEDFDGFGVLAHDECGYCTHPARDGKVIDGQHVWVCGICGDVEDYGIDGL
ncbi:hypothetical protein LCGC14_1424150 [marine sediment metagenome]|uniref:Uncharacterized protein n=1 Tax=marine sediment metagenome TaxID=412755 RepID=A0A0F9JQA9_9ZZZZ